MTSTPPGPPPLNLPFRTLSIDLEVSRENESIKAVAAVRSDPGRNILSNTLNQNIANSLNTIDAMSQDADVLVGHNIIAFDIPHLQALRPDLELLKLPVIDTLRLNPLAFPRNPYHHLVKHYQDGQIKRGQTNNPELDAIITLEILQNQLSSFRKSPKDLLTVWHWLTTLENGAGFDAVFSHVRNAAKPTKQEALQTIRTLLKGQACITRVKDITQTAHLTGWSLAYTLAWLSVSGGNSVMPPWVTNQFPLAAKLVKHLRDAPCHNPECKWCKERHNPTKELNRWFGFPSFRTDPVDEHGNPLQEQVVQAAMAGENLLAILPTGAGKSLCYQIPALSKYDKTGALTVVISPLVAPMADQVAGLEAKGINSCITINGLLSMPERAEALDRVRMGAAAILLISPEVLRNSTVCKAIGQRQVGTWVLDEAHCLSKWGHDFRSDYRYIGRFIKQNAGKNSPPPVICLTATAKPDVIMEITDYFQNEMGIDLKIFNGGNQRTNLDFVVIQTTPPPPEKLAHIHQVIQDDLPPDEPGGAIIYCATRQQTEDVAKFLNQKGIAAEYFHAKIPPETKKNIQENFIQGNLRAIVATNAFGMGIDKPDVRLVIHADIPGSLENYIQEAGRAGRDQHKAKCVLLYTTEDVERQFGMSARNRLSRRDIRTVLRSLRNMDRRKRLKGEVIATPGEILTQDDEGNFERDSATDDTRVRTAVSWLENAELLTREDNYTQVFPSSLRVNSAQEAERKLARSKTLNPHYRQQLLEITQHLIDADPDEGISTDELMTVTGMNSESVRAALHNMETLGLASNDTAITAFVHSGVTKSSEQRLRKASAMEEDLIASMQESHPDMEIGDTSPLHLRITSQQLRDQGHEQALPEYIRRLINSIAGDGRGEGGAGGSINVKHGNSETIQLTTLRDWTTLSKMAEAHRTAADRILKHLLSQLPPGTRGTDLLAETTMSQLANTIKSDITLSAMVRDHAKLMDRALMWLHEQEIIRLNKGLAVFRQAMTIRLGEERRGFTQTDYASLNLHYEQQTLQIHVMAEYANQGLKSMAQALNMAMDYFNMEEQEFIKRWLPSRRTETSRQTTHESWQAIVENLNNPNQRRIAADDRDQTNVLVLAGPGSGKTKVLVHRIAYLIRVKRENPKGILALAYNRHAAVEIRRRLLALIGDDARGVMILTCHALAMRLAGASFETRANRLDDNYFKETMKRAIALLRGEGLDQEEADDYRSRVLSGFRWILVDEYQDIGPEQYELISAIAGRTLSEEDERLTIFAVGDDDQNIYAFNGSSTEFIRKFSKDYQARPFHLTDNYRSTTHIIRTANAVIAPALDRMKTEHPIHINRSREKDHPGGAWNTLDPIAQGRVQVLPAGDTSLSQAQAAVTELRRLSALDQDWDWSKCAVIARRWNYLDPVHSLCELEGIPAQMANQELSAIWHLRETQALADWAKKKEPPLVTTGEIAGHLTQQTQTKWTELLQEAAQDYHLETGGLETPSEQFIEWLAEWSQETRRSQKGLLLLTAHSAKGLEFDHVIVLDGGWDRLGTGEDQDAQRRLYYVAMTRAKKTLALCRFPTPQPLQNGLPEDSTIFRNNAAHTSMPTPPELRRRYVKPGMKSIFLSFSGYKPPDNALHKHIANLSPGDPLTFLKSRDRWELRDTNNNVVGLMARSFRPPEGMKCASAQVSAICVWDRQHVNDSTQNENYTKGLKSDRWEVVVPTLMFEPEHPHQQQRKNHDGTKTPGDPT